MRKKCIDYVLVSEVMLNIVKGIELIEWEEIVDSDHRGHLTYLNLEFFRRRFNKEQEIEQRLLNPNKIIHRKEFFKTCEEFLNATPIE